jgi:hypothetical protein
MLKLFQGFDVEYYCHLQDEYKPEGANGSHIGLVVGVSIRVLSNVMWP